MWLILIYKFIFGGWRVDFVNPQKVIIIPEPAPPGIKGETKVDYQHRVGSVQEIPAKRWPVPGMEGKEEEKYQTGLTCVGKPGGPS